MLQASEKIVERDFKNERRKDVKIDDKRAEKIKKFAKEYIKAKLEAQKHHHKKSKKHDTHSKDVKKPTDPRKPQDKGANESQTAHKDNSRDDGDGSSRSNTGTPLNLKRRSPPSSRPGSSLEASGNHGPDLKKIRSDTPPRDAASEDENDVPMDLSD